MGWDGLPRIDVEKSSYHHLSQNEIGSDNPCSRHLAKESGMEVQFEEGNLKTVAYLDEDCQSM